MNRNLLVKNISFLSIMQIVNMLAPLILVPFLLNSLGVSLYGEIVFAQSYIGLSSLLINFGFSLSATKEVSKYRDNKLRLGEIVKNIYVLKGSLFLVSIIGLVIFRSLFSISIDIFILLLYLPLYEWLFPAWFFQGIEKMKYLAFFSFISRLTLILLVLSFIKSESDFLLYPKFLAVSYISVIVISNVLLLREISFTGSAVSMERLRYYFADSYLIFISNLSSKIYAGSNKLIIGQFVDLNYVTFYDVAEKVVTLFRLPQSILNISIFPSASISQRSDAIKLIFRWSLVLHLLAYGGLVIFGKTILVLIGGEKMAEAYKILLLLAISAPLIVITTTYGIQLLIAKGYASVQARIALYTAGIFITEIFLLDHFDNINIYTVISATLVCLVFESISSYRLTKIKKL
jgi:O-antigen/teichoic acid export membrane protein